MFDDWKLEHLFFFIRSLLIVLSGIGICLSVQSRTFTSSDGVRKIEANITSFDEIGNVVSIIRSDGRTFNSKLSNFHPNDQFYVIEWKKGKKENHLAFRREYPTHVQKYLKLHRSGKIRFSNGFSKDAFILGNGSSPFRAWISGYDHLTSRYDTCFQSTAVFFDLRNGKWTAKISFQADQSIRRYQVSNYHENLYFKRFPRLKGTILLQSQNPIHIVGPNIKNRHSVFTLPKSPNIILSSAIFPENGP
tara:strand:+ start:727 stop:1470 length:744 start_codon:yes stop_codon:yes gene_type:complete